MDHGSDAPESTPIDEVDKSHKSSIASTQEEGQGKKLRLEVSLLRFKYTCDMNGLIHGLFISGFPATHDRCQERLDGTESTVEG